MQHRINQYKERFKRWNVSKILHESEIAFIAYHLARHKSENYGETFEFRFVGSNALLGLERYEESRTRLIKKRGYDIGRLLYAYVFVWL